MWKQKSDQDKETPPDLRHSWNNWKATLYELQSIKILRWYGFKFSRESAFELYVSADASRFN